MAKSHKSCMEQAEIIDTFGTYQWYDSLPCGSIKSPQDMAISFVDKNFTAHMQYAALQRIYNFKQLQDEHLPTDWGRYCALLKARLGHVGGMLPIIYFVVYHLCYNLLFLMLVTLGPSAMISDLKPLCFHEYLCVLDPIYELYAPIIVRNRRSQW